MHTQDWAMCLLDVLLLPFEPYEGRCTITLWLGDVSLGLRQARWEARPPLTVCPPNSNSLIVVSRCVLRTLTSPSFSHGVSSKL